MRSLTLSIVVGLALAAVSPASAIGVCAKGPRVTCVIDGDTFWWEGQRIRVAGIDAPERYGAACAAESALAWRSAERLASLLSGGRVEIAPTDDVDLYRRTIAEVSTDGTDVGQTLVAEGLARRWSGRREDWCSQ